MNINILLVIVIIAALVKVLDGYKKGMVKEIISLVSLTILCAVVALLAGVISNYHDGKLFNVIIVAILLGLIGIVHHLLSVVFFSAKLISKLPVVNFLNKLLGVAFGILEVVLVVWTVYTFVMMMDMGAIGQVILSYTEESEILSFIYRHNYLAYGIEQLLSKFTFLPLVG